MESSKKKILNDFLPDFVNGINPHELLPYLPCLSTASKEEVDTAQNSKSRNYAVYKLHEHLIRRPEGWDQLIKALRQPEIGQGHLADKLEPNSSPQQQQQKEKEGMEEEKQRQRNIFREEDGRLTGGDVGMSDMSPVNVGVNMTSPRRDEGDIPVRNLNNGVVRIMRALDYSGLKRSDDLAEHLGFSFQEVNELRSTAERGSLATALIHEYAKREDATLGNLMTILRDHLERPDLVGELEKLTGFKLPPLPETPTMAMPPDQRPHLFQTSHRESIEVSANLDNHDAKSAAGGDEIVYVRPDNLERAQQSEISTFERNGNYNMLGRPTLKVFNKEDDMFKSNGNENVSTMPGVIQENTNRIPQNQPSSLTTMTEYNESIDACKQNKQCEGVAPGEIQNTNDGQKYRSNDAEDLATHPYPNGVNKLDSYTNANSPKLGELDRIVRVQYIRQESQPPGCSSPALMTSPPVCGLAKTEKDSTIRHCLATSGVRQDESLTLLSTGNPRPLHGTDATEIGLSSSSGGQPRNESSGEMSSILRKGEKYLPFLRTESLENNTDSDVVLDSDTSGNYSWNDKHIGNADGQFETCSSGKDDIRTSKDWPQIEHDGINEDDNMSKDEVKDHRYSFRNTVPHSCSNGTHDSSRLSSSTVQNGTCDMQTRVPEVNAVRAELYDQDDNVMILHETSGITSDRNSDNQTGESKDGHSSSLFSGIARGVVFGTAAIAIYCSLKGSR